MTKILCIAAVVFVVVLAAAIMLARSIGHAQEEIENMKLDREHL